MNFQHKFAFKRYKVYFSQTAISRFPANRVQQTLPTPKDIRDKIGIKEYSEVIVDIIDDSVIIKKLKPQSVSYVDYYCATYSKKLTKRVDLKASEKFCLKMTWEKMSSLRWS